FRRWMSPFSTYRMWPHWHPPVCIETLDIVLTLFLSGAAVFLSHLVVQLYHAVLVGCDLCEMQRHVSVELVEERDPLADRDRHDRIANVIGQPETQAIGRKRTAAHEPDAAVCGLEPSVHELREVTGVELDGIPLLRQIAAREHERRFVPVRPAEPLRFEAKRRLVRSRPHHVAVDR